MALTDLAGVADLQTRGIDVTNTEQVEAFLESASTAVRNAAGCPITETTTTTEVAGRAEQWLPLPGGPVQSVESVTIHDAPITDWRVVGGRLYRWAGWCGPEHAVTVTYTHGLPSVPADVVELVCSLVGLALARTQEGYAARGDVTSESEGIDDYTHQVSYARGSTGMASPFELPMGTRRMLRTRFGAGGW